MDIYIRTLRNFIRAIGGELETNTVFSDGTIWIDQFHTIA